MASLYKRATPIQQWLLRIVEGAVRNYGHHHPDVELTERSARSIAKRAVGILSKHIAAGELAVVSATTRQGEAVSRDIASSMGSESFVTSDPDGAVSSFTTAPDRHFAPVYDVPEPLSGVQQRLAGGTSLKHRPSRTATKKQIFAISMLAAKARRENNTEALNAYIEVLRIIAPRNKK